MVLLIGVLSGCGKGAEDKKEPSGTVPKEEKTDTDGKQEEGNGGG